MTNYEKYDMFITIAKAYGNEIQESDTTSVSNKKTLKPASFTNIAAMLGGM